MICKEYASFAWLVVIFRIDDNCLFFYYYYYYYYLTLLFFQVQNPLKPKYNGMGQGLKYIWVNEGIKGFFKGNGANCARIVPNSAVKFYSYEQASRYFSTFLFGL
jgi:solute carrier family 25 phosphate transporter 23/24/25/41